MIDRLRAATAKAHRRGAWAFAAVLVVGAVSAGTGWYYGGGPGSTSSLPSMQGKTEDAASAQLRAQHFRVGTTTTAYSTTAEGRVSGTQPKAGTTLPQGAVVSIVLSQGPQPASAPTVKGMTAAEATAAVAHARLTLAGRVEKASSRSAGTAIRLVDEDDATIAPGTSLDAGTAVRLVVSSGPAVATPPGTGAAEADAAPAAG